MIEEASSDQGPPYSRLQVVQAMGVRRGESFSFSVQPNGHGAFSLYVHAKRDGAVALVGQWPTLEQAEKLAWRIQQRAFTVTEEITPNVVAQIPQAAE